MSSLTEKKKSSKISSKPKKAAKKVTDEKSLGEPVKSTKKKVKSKKPKDNALPTDEVKETLSNQDKLSGIDQAQQSVKKAVDKNSSGQVIDEAKEQAQEKVNELEQSIDTDDEFYSSDNDALSTMNAIMEYNRQLIQRLNELESKAESKGQEVSKQSVQDTVQDTYNDVKAKYEKKQDDNGVNHSFELPIGDMMKGYGNFQTEALPDDDAAESNEKDEESTVHSGADEGNKISIGSGGKDDIVVKVEATKTGIMFAIHIPRN
ncbi:hypothetical protein BD560DRAFT_382189 [Blakeslea trispora]|nr:hypothetical protein BD560DRAFT_382189 [Blakeslea trispora]